MLLAVALVVLLLGCAVLPASAELKASLTVSSPFDKHDHKGSRIIPYWEKSGSTNIMQTFVRVSRFQCLPPVCECARRTSYGMV